MCTQKNSLKQRIEEYSNMVSEYDAKREYLNDRIKIRTERLKRLKEKRDKLKHPHWIEFIIQPLAEDLVKHFPGYRYEVLGPFGLYSRVAIDLFKKSEEECASIDEYFSNGNSFSVILRPGTRRCNFADLSYETNESVGNYEKDTIEEINGGNIVTRKVNSVEELVNFLKSKQEEYGKNSETE